MDEKKIFKKYNKKCQDKMNECKTDQFPFEEEAKAHRYKKNYWHFIWLGVRNPPRIISIENENCK